MKQVFVVLLIFSQNLKAQTNFSSENVLNIIEAIEEHGILHSLISSKVIKTSKEYLLHEALKKNAREEDLISFLKYENPTIKCCAFRILCEQKNTQAFEIIKKDIVPMMHVRVTVNHGDFLFQERGSSFLISCLRKSNASYMQLETQELIDSIAGIHVYSEYVGYVGTPTKTYKFFYALMGKATKSELIQLTDHDSSSIRCYSFWALCDRKETNIFPILIKHLKDRALVIKHEGCVTWHTTVADFYIDLFIQNKIRFIEDYRLTRLNFGEKAQVVLDEKIANDINNLRSLKEILYQQKTNSKSYEIIRKFLEKEE